jgi:hypothetical protein
VLQYLADAPQAISVLGCESETFAKALGGQLKALITYTTHPFKWVKAGGKCPEYVLSKDSAFERHAGRRATTGRRTLS